MSRLVLTMALTLQAVLDATAVLIVAGRIGSGPMVPEITGLVIHVFVSCMTGAAVLLFPGTSHAAGRRSLAALLGLFCLLTPIVGCLAALVLSTGFRSAVEEEKKTAGLRFGNRLLERRNVPPAAALGSPRPLALEVAALQESPDSESALRALRRWAPVLRNNASRRSLHLLQHLSRHRDPYVQLTAQSLLGEHLDAVERRVHDARHRVKSQDLFADAWRQYAEALLHTASLRMVSPEETRRYIEEALEAAAAGLQRSPDDSDLIVLQARGLQAMDRLDSLPELHAQLQSRPHAQDAAERLGREILAVAGRWQAIRESLSAPTITENTALPPSARDFWEGPARIAHHAGASAW